MSTDTQERDTGLLTVDTRVLKIELDYRGGDDSRLDWSVEMLDDEEVNGRRQIMFVGHLIHQHEGSWIQALTIALASAKPVLLVDGLDAFIANYGAGIAEMIYDRARQAAGSTGALLDLKFELPMRSPTTDITPHVDAPEEG